MMAFIRPRLRKPLGIALAGTVFAAAWSSAAATPGSSRLPWR